VVREEVGVVVVTFEWLGPLEAWTLEVSELLRNLHVSGAMFRTVTYPLLFEYICKTMDIVQTIYMFKWLV
jgi:hypothetical protein